MSDRCNESIIVPMNPRGRYSGGSIPGSIVAQKWFSDRKGSKGKVIISFDKRCKHVSSSEKPTLGFFYDTDSRKVTHRFSIIDITDDEGVKKYERDFLPPWRRDLLKTKQWKRTWLLIKEIRRLKEPKALAYFGKRRAQSFVYSIAGAKLAYSEETTNPCRFIDDIVFGCAESPDEKFRERNLGLIMWALTIKEGAEYLDPELVVKGRGKKRRLDMLVKNSKGEHVLVELKLRTAEKHTLNNQLKPYMKKVMAERGLTRLKGLIVARKQSPDLKKELSKKENAHIRFSSYSFAFALDREGRTFLQ